MVGNLSERKIKLIKNIVEEYLKKPNPVSSGEIQRKYFKELCSATIRSEMSALEDMGYLVQPHASSGRIPTALAYKFYVENFVDKKPLKIDEKKMIQEAFKAGLNKIEDVVRATAKVISDITNYTSVIVIKEYENILIKEVKLVSLDAKSILVIIITDNGVLKDNVIRVNAHVEEGYIKDATLILNRIFQNLRLHDLFKTPLLIDRELDTFKEIIESVIHMVSTYKEDSEDNIFVDGETKILDYPETTLESARQILGVIDDKKTLGKIVSDVSDIEFSVKIGKDETGLDYDCSVVSAKMLIDGKEIGQAGVIGPKRMNYSKVMSVLSYIGDTLDTLGG